MGREAGGNGCGGTCHEGEALPGDARSRNKTLVAEKTEFRYKIDRAKTPDGDRLFIARYTVAINETLKTQCVIADYLTFDGKWITLAECAPLPPEVLWYVP